ncbi:MAG TPA: hypothetical protein VF817_05000 [Patescibacteria group bacterium]
MNVGYLIKSKPAMKTIQYSEILRRAFLLTWKNKFLWVLGLFIFIGSVVSNINFNPQDLSSQSASIPTAISSFFSQHQKTIENVFFLFVLLELLLFFLKIISNAAIIKSANDTKLYSQLPLRKILSEGLTYFYRLLFIEVLLDITVGLLALVFVSPILYLFSLNAFVSGILATVLAFGILVPLMILIYFIRRYSYYYVVLTNSGIKASLENGYGIFLQNAKKSLLMALLSIGIGLGFVLSLLLVLVLIGALASLISFGAYLLFAKNGLILVVLISSLFVLLFILLAFAAFTAFIQVLWLLFFKQISFQKSLDQKTEEELAAMPSPEAA